MIWLTWFIRSLVVYTVLSLLISIIGIVPVSPRSSANTTLTYVNRYIFQTTSFGVIFMTFFVYSLQVSMFTILMAQIFSKCEYSFFSYKINATTKDYLMKSSIVEK